MAKSKANTPRPCFLRQTQIRLLDGQEYSFRALPFNRQTAGFLESLFNEEGGDLGKLSGLAEAIELSLSYDNDAETVDYVMSNGLVPFGSEADTPEGDTFNQVMAALVSQFSKTN